MKNIRSMKSIRLCRWCRKNHRGKYPRLCLAKNEIENILSVGFESRFWKEGFNIELAAKSHLAYQKRVREAEKKRAKKGAK